MAFEIPVLVYSLVSGEDGTGNQYTFQKVNSSGQTIKCGSGDPSVGVLQNKPSSGNIATLAKGGISKVKAGAAVNPGEVQSDATGRAIALAAGKRLGIALEGASAAGIEIPVLLD